MRFLDDRDVHHRRADLFDQRGEIRQYTPVQRSDGLRSRRRLGGRGGRGGLILRLRCGGCLRGAGADGDGHGRDETQAFRNEKRHINDSS